MQWTFTFRWRLLGAAVLRIDKDGLNSLNYNVTSKEYRQLFTHIMADVKLMEHNDLKYIPGRKKKH